MKKRKRHTKRGVDVEDDDWMGMRDRWEVVVDDEQDDEEGERSDQKGTLACCELASVGRSEKRSVSVGRDQERGVKKKGTPFSSIYSHQKGT
jgi:hypothetical protein